MTTALAYAQARIQAREGAFPDEAVWSRLHAASSLSQVLQVGRSTGLAPWLERLDAEMTVHELEARLREEARAHVREVASWLPESWQPAVEWCAVLIDLPGLRALLDCGSVAPWIRQDAVLGRWAAIDPSERRSAMQRSELAPLLAGGGARLLESWAAHFRALVPAVPRVEREELEALQTLLGAHVASMAAAEVDVDGWRLRRELLERLRRGFRRTEQQPAAVLHYLALAALRWERLRGAVVRRSVLPHVRSERSWV